MSKTIDYRNHIKNSEIETREFFERETSIPENIQRTLPMNIVTRQYNSNHQIKGFLRSPRSSRQLHTYVKLK